jgi:hypothetical protein
MSLGDKPAGEVGGAVGLGLTGVCATAVEAAWPNPVTPVSGPCAVDGGPTFCAAAEGPLGPAGPIMDGEPCVGPAGAAVKPGLTPSMEGKPIVWPGD